MFIFDSSLIFLTVIDYMVVTTNIIINRKIVTVLGKFGIGLILTFRLDQKAVKEVSIKFVDTSKEFAINSNYKLFNFLYIVRIVMRRF